NGTSWTAVSNTSRVGLCGVAAISANDVWAVGSYSSSPPTLRRPESMHWDGSSWSQVSMPDRGALFNYIYAVAAVSSNDVWAVGDNDYPPGTLIEHYATVPCVTGTATTTPPTSTRTPTRTVTPTRTPTCGLGGPDYLI